MNIVACPSCGCQCKVPVTAAGKKVKCPRCATPFAVPSLIVADSPSPQATAKGETASPRIEKEAAAAAATKGGRRSPVLLLALGCAALLALAGAAGGGGLLVWWLLLRAPTSPRNDGAPVANSKEETKQTPQGPSAEEIKAQQELRAARRRSQKNLKELALAFMNYADTYGGQCPPAMSVRWPHPPPKNQRPRQQPLLSWRVFLLPFLEENDLYRDFKLDEPWDSPHNKKLLGKMPKIYAPVRGTTPEPGMTYYQVFVGDNTPFLPADKLMPPPPGFPPGVRPPEGGPRFPASILDGTRNTFLVVEAGEPVPWTKPADLEYDDNKPLPKLGGLFPDGFHAATFDATLYFIPRDFSEKDLRRMINPRDGEIIESELKPLSDKDEASAEDTNPNDKGTIRGKVTYKGLPLNRGTITFAGSMTYSAPIAADGSYQVRDVPVGKYKIAIATVPVPPREMPRFPRDLPGMPKEMLPKDAPGVPPKPGVTAIPAKYGDPNTSGLTYTVVKGINTHDFRLE